MSQEEADQLFQSYITDKEAKIAKRFEQTLAEKEEFRLRINGTPTPIYVEETAATEALSDFQEEAASEEASVSEEE